MMRFPFRLLWRSFALFLIALCLMPSARAQLVLADLYYAMPAPDSNSLTPTLKLTWTVPGNVGVGGLKKNGVNFVGSFIGNSVLDTAWTSGTQYTYYLYGTAQVYNPATMMTETQNWQSNSVVVRPYNLSATDNATADSRLDPRYAATTYVNFPFNDTNTANNPLWLYRGGLYSGYNADGGKVGRAYLKFALSPAGVATTIYPVGGLYLFSTRLAKTGNTSASFVVKRSSDATSWTAPALNWGNAPVPTGTSGAISTISWNSASPACAWYKVDAKTPVQDYLSTSGTGVLTLILMAQSEATPGWGYFARKEYTYNSATGYGARLLIGVQ